MFISGRFKNTLPLKSIKEKLNKLSLNPRIYSLTYSETYPSWSSKNWHTFIWPNIIHITVIEERLKTPIETDNKTITPTETKVETLNSFIFDALSSLFIVSFYLTFDCCSMKYCLMKYCLMKYCLMKYCLMKMKNFESDLE